MPSDTVFVIMEVSVHEGYDGRDLIEDELYEYVWHPSVESALGYMHSKGLFTKEELVHKREALVTRTTQEQMVAYRKDLGEYQHLIRSGASRSVVREPRKPVIRVPDVRRWHEVHEMKRADGNG